MRRNLKPTPASTSTSNDAKQVGSLRATRKQTDLTQSSSTNVPGASEASTFGSGHKIESALVKFFGGPPTCLGENGKRKTKGQISPSKIPGSKAPSQTPIKWTDILSDGVDLDRFKRQRSGKYRYYISGKVIEISGENYRFISLGYPQRMMQSSSLPEIQKEHETAGSGNEGHIKPPKLASERDIESSDEFLPDSEDLIDSTDTSTGSDIPYEINQYNKRVSPAHQESQFRTGHRIYKPKQSDHLAHQKNDTASEKLGSLATDQINPMDHSIEAGIPTGINDSSEVSSESVDESSGCNNKSESPICTTSQMEMFIPWIPSPTKDPDPQVSSAIPDTTRNTSPRKPKRPLYSEREVSEGPAFIKALIQAGIPWEKQEELYASEFGVSRPQVGLLQRFNLSDMRHGDFEPAVFKNPVCKYKFQPSRYSSERGVYITSNAASKTSDGDGENNMASTEEEDPKLSVSAMSESATHGLAPGS